MQDSVLEAEQSLLAAILIRPGIFKSTRVVEEDFEDLDNRKIFRVMGELSEDGQPIDPTLIHQKLNDKKLLLYMMDLCDHGISANWQYYDRQVREHSCKRKLAALAGHLGQWANNSHGPGEILEKLKNQVYSLEQKIADGHKPLSQRVREWVLATSGVFYVTDCYRDFGLVTDGDKAATRMSLMRLAKEGVIKPHGHRRGCYRLVENLYEVIDHENADDTPLDIILPFGLHKHMEWFPKGIGVVAGDTDAGKTAIMLNLAYNNQGKFPRVVYIATEMGSALLKRRLQKFCQANDYFYPDAVKGITFHSPKTTSLMDLVESDAFNVIDYYELSGDQFRDVGGYFRQIYDRLDNGVCFVALQKKFGANLGRAAELAMEKPLLYLTLHRGGIARIEKCKTEWTEDFQPYAIEFKYKLWGGGKLLWGKRLRGKKEAEG